MGVFYPRLAAVQAAYNDGSRRRAEAIAGWVAAVGGDATAYVEQLALGNWGVVVLRPEQAEALWVLTDHHLVFDPRRQPTLDVYSDAQFHRCFAVSSSPSVRVRECPIYEEPELAS